MALGPLAIAVVPLVDKRTLRWSVPNIRSSLIVNSLHDPQAELLRQPLIPRSPVARVKNSQKD
jgi:hypothetical protein